MAPPGHDRSPSGGIVVVSVAVTALATLTDPLTGEEHGSPRGGSCLSRVVVVETVATRVGVVQSAWAASCGPRRAP
jgi:hypothetical protein